jgi:hypothetical protein
MNKNNLFGLEFDIFHHSIKGFGLVVEHKNSQVEFYITREALNNIADDRMKLYEEIIFSIYRYYKKGFELIVCSDEEISKHQESTDDFIYISLSQLVNEVPRNIEETTKWIMESIYMKNARYGERITGINSLDFLTINNNTRYKFFTDLLVENKLIEAATNEALNGFFEVRSLLVLSKGWNYIEEKLIKSDQTNRKVFIAMWFDDKMNKAYESIIRALTSLKLIGIRIDKKPHNNDITREIMYEIKNCRFLIADVSGQRPGVYYEAGFAFGIQRPVIWTCKRDDFSNVHFDTRQYNHIVWENEESLYDQLLGRIKGTIM